MTPPLTVTLPLQASPFKKTLPTCPLPMQVWADLGKPDQGAGSPLYSLAPHV